MRVKQKIAKHEVSLSLSLVRVVRVAVGTIAQIRQKKAASPEPQKHGRGTVCIKCGVRIKAGGMLEHKEQVHGEFASPAIKMPHNPNRWIRVYSGGLPSLGKKSR